MKWLINDATFGLFTFKELTRSISLATGLAAAVRHSLLSSGFLHGPGFEGRAGLAAPYLDAVIAVAVLLAHYAGGRKLGLLIGGCFLYLVVFDQWDSA